MRLHLVFLSRARGDHSAMSRVIGIMFWKEELLSSEKGISCTALYGLWMLAQFQGSAQDECR